MLRLGHVLLSCIAGSIIACGADDSRPDAGPTGAGGGGSPAMAGTSGGGKAGSSAAAGTSGGGKAGNSAAAGTSGAGEAGSNDGDGGDGATPPAGAGIAARYPGDVGIGDDPEVIFADDFESYAQAGDLEQNWDAVYQLDQIRFATESENVNSGSQALEFTVPQQEAELSNAVDKILSEPRDVLFLRYYSKFQPPYDVVGSSHNGSMISAQYFDNGQATPGIPADGTNKFLVNLENWRGEPETPSPGLLNVYVYHPEQRSQWGDHFFPSGTVLPNSSMAGEFGSDFVAREDIIPELDRWYCYEYMVQANTPGERDGRIAAWLDGALVAEFANLTFRDIETLKIDRFGLSFHIGSNTAGETKKWFDDVVAASSYIGPLVTP